MALLIKIDATRPLRRGSEFFWKTILRFTEDKPTFTYKEIDGQCDLNQEKQLRKFLTKLVGAGYIEQLSVKRTAPCFRVLKRQRDCPILTRDGREGLQGKAQQNMWNVMRRSHGGFTVKSLMLDASTDDISINRNHAKNYCSLLERAGVLVVQQVGNRLNGGSVYVLKGRPIPAQGPLGS